MPDVNPGSLTMLEFRINEIIKQLTTTTQNIYPVCNRTHTVEWENSCKRSVRARARGLISGALALA
jgi:hypothetical protein